MSGTDDHLIRPLRDAARRQVHRLDPVSPTPLPDRPGDRRDRLDHRGHGCCSVAPPTPARFASRVEFLKNEVYEICGALALGESLLKRSGLISEAVHLAAVFDVVEGRLALPAPYEGAGSEFSS